MEEFYWQELGGERILVVIGFAEHNTVISLIPGNIVHPTFI